MLTCPRVRSKALLAVALGLDGLLRLIWSLLMLGERFEILHELFDEPWEAWKATFRPNALLRLGSVVLLLVFVLILKEELRARAPAPATPAPGGWS